MQRKDKLRKIDRITELLSLAGISEHYLVLMPLSKKGHLENVVQSYVQL